MNRRSAVASTRVAFNTYWIPTLGPRRRGDACIVQNEDGYLKCAVTDQELHATTQEICALYRANRPHGSNNGINYRIPSRLQCADQAGSLWRIGRTGRSTLCCSSAPHQPRASSAVARLQLNTHCGCVGQFVLVDRFSFTLAIAAS